MTYAEIRQRILAQLSPEMNRAEVLALLQREFVYAPADGMRRGPLRVEP